MNNETGPFKEIRKINTYMADQSIKDRRAFATQLCIINAALATFTINMLSHANPKYMFFLGLAIVMFLIGIIAGCLYLKRDIEREAWALAEISLKINERDVEGLNKLKQNDLEKRKQKKKCYMFEFSVYPLCIGAGSIILYFILIYFNKLYTKCG